MKATVGHPSSTKAKMAVVSKLLVLLMFVFSEYICEKNKPWPLSSSALNASVFC